MKRNIVGTRDVTLPVNNNLYFNTGKEMGKSEITIIWMGTNGGYSDFGDLLNQQKLAAKNVYNGKYIIIGLHKLTKIQGEQYETLMKKEFGNKFFNLREYCTTNFIYDAGITPTSEDLTAMTNGICPPSLLYDTTHFKPSTNAIIGQRLYEMIIQLGYIQ